MTRWSEMRVSDFSPRRRCTSLPAAVLLFGVLMAPNGASAQRREAAGDRVLTVELPFSVKFGPVTVSPRLYRVTLRDGRLSLIDPGTMLLITALETEVSESAESVNPPKVDLVTSSKKPLVDVVVRNRQKVYTARGVRVVSTRDRRYSAQLTSKSEPTLAEQKPETVSDLALVMNVLKRYSTSVEHCAEKAGKSRWTTDDPRFVRCLCPQTEKWLFPKVSATLRAHYPMPKERAGFSVTVGVNGKPTACRVWVGKEPPAGDVAGPVPEPAAATDEVAPSAEVPSGGT